jgi:hypothetical protein
MTAVAAPAKSTSRVFVIWLVLGIIASVLLPRLPFPVPQLIVIGLTGLAFVALRDNTLPLRWLFGVNALRSIVVFLVPPVPAGAISPLPQVPLRWS